MRRADPVARALDRVAPDILRYLERRLGTDNAADALAEVMIAAWRRSADLPQEEEQARMWLFGIARNVVANAVRGEQRRNKLAERLRGAMAIAGHGGASADDGLDVRDAISRLSPEQAELVRLVHWDGFTIAAAGDILGIPASTARTRYQTARAELRDALSATRTGGG